MNGAYTWRRPTLTRPIVSLPLALKRFTSGFGMGPGGSTSLWSPEGNLGLARVSEFNAKLNLWGPEEKSWNSETLRYWNLNYLRFQLFSISAFQRLSWFALWHLHGGSVLSLVKKRFWSVVLGKIADFEEIKPIGWLVLLSSYITAFTLSAYQRGSLPRSFRENSS